MIVLIIISCIYWCGLNYFMLCIFVWLAFAGLCLVLIWLFGLLGFVVCATVNCVRGFVVFGVCWFCCCIRLGVYVVWLLFGLLIEFCWSGVLVTVYVTVCGFGCIGCG